MLPLDATLEPTLPAFRSGGKQTGPAMPLLWSDMSASWLSSTSAPVGLALATCGRRGTSAMLLPGS
eukprot:8940325-Prorocentrum_lima.AAC.1